MNEIYRDPTEGAAARRHDLLGRRRDELVTMPHAIRRVVVARWGRIVASLAAWIGAEAMVIAAVYPPAAAKVSHLLPGREPAPLSTLLVAAWVLGLVAYWIARSAAEHRFAVAMTRTVLPGDDVFHDLERLDNVHPDEVARSMAHRLEVLSAALPVAAAATILPATIAYIAMGVGHGGWPSERMYEEWLAAHAGTFAWLALGGLGAAMLMTRRAARLPIVAPIAAVATAAAAAGAAKWWWLVGPAAIAVTVAIVVRRLRIERDRIQAEDPAAGSEVFTLRGFIAQCRSSFASARAFVRGHRRGVAACVILLVGGGLLLSMRHTTEQMSQARAEMKPLAPTDFGKLTAVPHLGSRSTYKVDQVTCENMAFVHGNCLRVEITFHDREAVVLPSVFPGVSSVPAGWNAELAARFEFQESTAAIFAIDGLGESQLVNRRQTTAAFHAAGCGAALPTTLTIAPDPNEPIEQHVVLTLAPTLELAPACADQKPAPAATP